MDDKINVWLWPLYDDRQQGAMVTPPSTGLVGYRLEATDGFIGEIDEATYDMNAGYLVVDTGPWIFGKKRIIPVGVITDMDSAERTVTVSCTKDQIRTAPDYDADLVAQEDRQYHATVSDHFGNLLHRLGSR